MCPYTKVLNPDVLDLSGRASTGVVGSTVVEQDLVSVLAQREVSGPGQPTQGLVIVARSVPSLETARFWNWLKAGSEFWP